MNRASRLERRTPLRARMPEKGGPVTRHTTLRAKRWGVKPAPKVENWRKDFMPEYVTKEKGPKYTAFELAWFAYVRSLPCAASHLGRCWGPMQASHLTLSADQKGTAMKVPHRQTGPLCKRHHDFWDGRNRKDNPFDALSKDDRYEMAQAWLEVVHEAATPGDDRDHADELERLGLGKVTGNGTPYGWNWLPGHLSEADAETLMKAAPL